MADEGGAAHNTAGPGATADHHNTDIPQQKQFNAASRKSTLTKSGFDVNATSYGGTSTPMGTGRESIDITDYFVRFDLSFEENHI
jgi:3-oxoacyl-(acyl-carrier-protein) synthase